MTVVRQLMNPLADRTGPVLSVPGGPQIEAAELVERAGRFAASLAELGVAPGDRVAVQIDTSIDAVALHLGILSAGAVTVPLNPSFTAHELEHYLTDAEPRVFVVAPERRAAVADVARHHGVVHLETLGVEADGSLAQRAAATTGPAPIIDRADDDLAALLYTSGTTGRPKGAMLTHGGLAANGHALVEVWGLSADDVLVHCLPLFHVHGLFIALHTMFLAGGRTILLPRFSVDGVRSALPEASVFMAVPAIWRRLLDDPDVGDDMRHLRLVTSGSAPLSELVFAEIEQRTGHRPVERYGMSEAGIITSNPLHGDRLPGSVGFALPGYELRVAADATDDPAVAGDDPVGEVQIRGGHLFAGYWKRDDATSAAFTDDGWFRTGDLGSIDAEGRLRLRGRGSDMIISGGENVYPKEIELVLDAIDGIVESAVVGLPDPAFGEAVTAFVVLAPGIDAVPTEAIDAACRAKLARFKHPKSVRVVDELPRNAMGKITKATLRAGVD